MYYYRMKRRVVITGLGVIAPNGIGKDEFWHANIEGRSGVDYLDRFDIEGFDTSRLNSKIAGRVKNFNPADFIPSDIVKRTDRFVHLGLAAAKMAVEDSRLNLDEEDRQRVGACIGSGLGGVPFHEITLMAGYERGLNKLNPLSVPKISPNMVSSLIALFFNINGPNMTISTACASGTHAIGKSYRIIKNEEADIMFAGGAEAPLTSITFGAYCAMHVLSRRNNAPQEASRPFDKDRDGFVLSEGAAVLILEELSHALRRGAHIYAEVAGYASNSGAYHMVIPEPNGHDAAEVMAACLKEADIGRDEVDYINAHGTSTLAGDIAETKTVKEVFGGGAYNIPVSSTKSMIGHTIGAAGAIEGVVCALSIEDNIIPPTINYSEGDPECDLDYVPNEARSARVDTVLSNSFGFGSNNTCIVMRRIRG